MRKFLVTLILAAVISAVLLPMVLSTQASIDPWSACERAERFDWLSRADNIACYMEVKYDLFGSGWEDCGDSDDVGGCW
jgi:hypothetical protein